MRFGQQVAGQDRQDHWDDDRLQSIEAGQDITSLDPCEVTEETAAALVARAWANHNSKTNLMRWDDWRRWFARAGYSVNGKQARRPLRPVRLYRGGHPQGWHWSSSVAVAQAHGGQLWWARVAPAALLCVVPFGWADEYAVDPDLLTAAPELVTDVRAAARAARFEQLKAELIAEARDRARTEARQRLV